MSNNLDWVEDAAKIADILRKRRDKARRRVLAVACRIVGDIEMYSLLKSTLPIITEGMCLKKEVK
jgi:hypothetical protein